MDEVSRNAFKAIFNEEFASNLQRGLSKSQAAAEALTTAQQLLLSSSSSSASSSPAPIKKLEPAPLPPSPPRPKTQVEVVQVVKPPEPIRISSDIMRSLVEECEGSSSFTPIIRLVGEVFSSPEKLGVCFAHCLTSEDNTNDNEESDEMDVSDNTSDTANDSQSVTEVVQEPSGDSEETIDVNLEEVSEVYTLLQRCQQHSEGVGNSIRHALEGLTYQLLTSPPTAHPLRLYFVVLEFPSLLDPSFSQTLRNLLHALDRLPNANRPLLSSCIRQNALGLVNHKDEEVPRLCRYLDLLKEHITNRLNAGAVQDMRYAVRAISLIYNAVHGAPVSHEDEKEGSPLLLSSNDQNSLVETLSLTTTSFYLDDVCSRYMTSVDGKKTEYKLWRLDLLEKESEMEKNGSVEHYQCQSMISFPYVLTAATKAAILELDANVEMRQVVNQEYNQAVASGSRYMIPYLVMRIRRSHIMEDTLNHFVANTYTDTDFKKPLKVVFDDEEGIDEGGVRKEYYQIMMKQLLDPNYGMFKYFEESRLLWFNSDSFESDSEFELIGILLGVAIYNAIIVDFQMPKCIYRKLMGMKCSLEDLRELQPDLAKGLSKILECNDPEEFRAVYGDLCFQITYEMLGERRAIDLKPNGGEEEVTFESRDEYVSLYVSYLLEESVETQFSAFARGFRKVCGGAALDLFNAEELELLICGNPTLDTHDLQAGTRYQDGYTGDEEVVTWFWETLHEFSEENKRNFLRFLSGSDRSPIDGLSKLHFVISRNGDDESRLPSAHTCFNHMLLPQYSSKEILREKLLYAMQNAAEGFGLL